MKVKKLVLPLLGFLMLSGILMGTVTAPAWPSLPSTTVHLTVVDGTTSYFISTLSLVPGGFDVTNKAYPGWCVDRSVTMTRSVAHDVRLYSSISPPVLSSINWVAVNYILNHKQGTMMDVQNAIWHFTDNYTPPGGFTAAAQAMINAANAHPGYDLTTAPILAIICLPQSDPDAQDSIIELTRPAPGFTPGFWKHNIGVYLGISNGAYSAFEGGSLDGVKLTDAMFSSWSEAFLEDAYETLSTGGGGAIAKARADMANYFNAAFGYGPFTD